MSGKGNSEARKGEDRWYGTRKGNQYLVYQGIEEKFPEIFDSLRDGLEVNLPQDESKSIPDLRDFLIRYGKYRLKQSLHFMLMNLFPMLLGFENLLSAILLDLHDFEFLCPYARWCYRFLASLAFVFQ